MSNETKTNRTQLTDLPVAEQELTAEEMTNVQGGKMDVKGASAVTTSPSGITAPAAGAGTGTPQTNRTNFAIDEKGVK